MHIIEMDPAADMIAGELIERVEHSKNDIQIGEE